MRLFTFQLQIEFLKPTFLSDMKVKGLLYQHCKKQTSFQIN